MEWHEGENALRSLLRVPAHENPKSPGLSLYAARLLLKSSPLLAIGTLDRDGWPWTTILTSTDPETSGPAQPMRGGGVGVSVVLGERNEQDDPVVEILRQSSLSKSTMRNVPSIGGLGISLEERERIKISGKLLGTEIIDEGASRQLRMGIFVEWSLGNCPKYLNKKHVLPHVPSPVAEPSSLPLSAGALALLEKADLFFISSSYRSENLGTNHRGGPPGFVRVARNAPPEADGTILVYPEYSGNRLYQTLGNLIVTPRAGLVFPDFDTGDAFYVTGTTEIVTGKEAAMLLPRSNLVVKIHVRAARFVRDVLAFRAIDGERSPYNPQVRYLANEKAAFVDKDNSTKAITATMLSRTMLTPKIARFRFRVSDSSVTRWRAGQYVALDFSDELSVGYAHMRDDDPKSLNDDFVRTFTVSSPSPLASSAPDALPHDQFEITIQNVGVVTNFLFKQNVRASLEVPLRGFGGSFQIKSGDSDTILPFIAGRIGITPLLAHLTELDIPKVRLYWSLHVQDAGLALDTFKRFPQLAQSTKLYLSGGTDSDSLKHLNELDVDYIATRRITAADIDPTISKTWYLCAGPALRKDVLKWLGPREVLYEDFNY